MAELSLGALGGPETFGGQAAAALRRAYPEFAEVRYFERSADAFGGPHPADARCVPALSSRTGPYGFAHRELLDAEPPRFVVAEADHAYHCALLGRPGTSLGDVTQVLGHTGSIVQSRDWLDEHLPGAAVRIVDTSSIAAADEVRRGDGRAAAVGTSAAADALGLEVLAADIDGGSVGHYWAVSLVPRFSAAPTRCVAAARALRDGCMSRLFADLLAAGFTVSSVWTDPSGGPGFDCRWVACFEGSGTLPEVQASVARHDGVRLAGAYRGAAAGGGSTSGGEVPAAGEVPAGGAMPAGGAVPAAGAVPRAEGIGRRGMPEKRAGRSTGTAPLGGSLTGGGRGG